ncbi:MAG TPA: hypothetical protein VN615_00655 [Gaiellales bacterium]|jgi:hypothetical protein|nr:hypothetical protein [Gaiellales bacterium]
MADPDHTGGDFHLPSPSALPFATSIGIALVLAGLVPDARIWRLALVSIGFIVIVIFGAQWLRDAVDEYRDLPE